MKRKLTPEASGTLAALTHHHKIKSFSPECAEELLSHDFVVQKGHHLRITDKGRHAAKHLYAGIGPVAPADAVESIQVGA
jgi:superfamily II helicase